MITVNPNHRVLNGLNHDCSEQQKKKKQGKFILASGCQDRRVLGRGKS